VLSPSPTQPQIIYAMSRAKKFSSLLQLFKILMIIKDNKAQTASFIMIASQKKFESSEKTSPNSFQLELDGAECTH